MSDAITNLLNEAYTSVMENDEDIKIDFSDGELLNKHFSELGLESLKILEMVGYIEDKQGFLLSDDEIAQLSTVEDIKKILYQKIST